MGYKYILVLEEGHRAKRKRNVVPLLYNEIRVRTFQTSGHLDRNHSWQGILFMRRENSKSVTSHNMQEQCFKNMNIIKSMTTFKYHSHIFVT